jgi:hypothetical protein
VKINATVVLIGFSLYLATSPLLAADGVLISEQTVTGTTTRTSQVQLERDRMRAEMLGAQGTSQVIVFDGPQQVLRMINHAKKSYVEMTKADADRVGTQIGGAMAKMNEMKEMIAKMPPAQRAQMEAAMAKMGGAQIKTDYRRAGSDKVGKWTCDKYEGFKNDLKVSELCTVDAKALGLTPADFEISKQVGEFFKTLAPQGAEQLFGVGTLETHGFVGIPVRRIAYSNGQVQSTSQILDIQRQTFAASTYEVPAGFQKQTMGRLGQ